MKWSNLLSADRINTKPGLKSIDISDYYLDLNYITSSRMIHSMQEKSFVYPINSNHFVRTQYSCDIEIAVYSRLILNKAFYLMDKYGKPDTPDEITRAHICELLSCAGTLKMVGCAPFGRMGERAIREWFISNLKEIKYNGKSVHDSLTGQMRRSFYEFSGSGRSLRRIVKYNDSDMHLTFSVLSALINIRDRNKNSGFFYSEHDLVDLIAKQTRLSELNHPLSYILGAASYVVEITSAIDDASEVDNLLCRRILCMLRNEENFDEKTESGEYQKFASIVNRLSSSYIELKSNPLIQSESGIVHKWIACVRNEMSDLIAQSFYENYDIIMEGKYKGSLISDSWCRIFFNAFTSIEKKLLISSEKFIGIEFKISKIIDFLLDSFIKAVINFDKKDYNNITYKNLINAIPESYINVYEKESAGKEEEEKLYLRIMMIVDYVCDMTDIQAESIYKQVNGII